MVIAVDDARPEVDRRLARAAAGDAAAWGELLTEHNERLHRIVSFRLTIPDQPGVLGQIATRLGQLGVNILAVEHRRLFLDVPAKGAKLDVTVEARDRSHAERIFKALEGEGFQPMWIDTATMME